MFRGIDKAFERQRRTGSSNETVNSLAYCSHAVAVEARGLAYTGGTPPSPPADALSDRRVRAFLDGAYAAYARAGLEDLARSIASLDLATIRDSPETTERRLAEIERIALTRLRERATDQMLNRAHEQIERELKPYRGRMTVQQLAQIEQHFLDRWLLEVAELPRLSLGSI